MNDHRFDRVQTISQLAAKINKRLDDLFDFVDEDGANVLPTLRGYPDGFLRVFKEMLNTGQFTDEGAIAVNEGNEAAVVLDRMRFIHCFKGSGISTRDRGGIVASLYAYPQLAGYQCLSESDHLIRKQCEAIIEVGVAFYQTPDIKTQGDKYLVDESGRDSFVIADADLKQRLFERPGDAARISNIILDRKTINYATIKSVLDAPAASLSGGAL